MPGFLRRTIVAVACLLTVLLTVPGSVMAAARSSETVLPNSTKGLISIANVEELRSNWNKTQFGQFLQDPIMQPFAEDLRRQLAQKWTQTHEKLGLTWADLEGVPAGEVSVAVIQPAKDQAALAVLVDITDHGQQASALLEKIAKNLLALQAKRRQQQVHGTCVTVFDLPAREERPAAEAIFFVKDNLLGASDNMKVIEGMLARLGRPSSDALAGLPAFDAVMKRCQSAAGEQAPQLRWFVEPLGYAETLRAASGHSRRKGTDFLKILRNQGFGAIQGAGGYLNFATEKHEMLHRTAIYAPPVKLGEQKYNLAANILDFPNGGRLEPQPWVPREITSYARVNWNMQGAFEASKTLVNEVVGDEVFEDVLQQIIDDPNGPQINIRKDLIGLLGTHATVISDYQLPITPKSERLLLAAETTNETLLRATIEKSMKTDPDARRREAGGFVIWEIVDEEAAVPMVTIERNAKPGSTPEDESDAEEKEHHILPSSAVAVAHGHLLVATHVDFLIKILSTAGKGRLDEAADFCRVRAELEQLGGDQNCAQTFSRTDDEYRAVYELIRTGRMPEAETMLGKVLNLALGDGKEGVPRAQRIDGSKLPDFELVKHYFGPAGLTVTSEENGWFLTGFTLTKEGE